MHKIKDAPLIKDDSIIPTEQHILLYYEIRMYYNATIAITTCILIAYQYYVIQTERFLISGCMTIVCRGGIEIHRHKQRAAADTTNTVHTRVHRYRFTYDHVAFWMVALGMDTYIYLLPTSQNSNQKTSTASKPNLATVLYSKKLMKMKLRWQARTDDRIDVIFNPAPSLTSQNIWSSVVRGVVQA